ncbi:MAG: hemolysin III family protein [Thermoanaerobaculia bacterium]
MGTTRARVKRAQTLGEEIANSISHCVGAVAALVGFPFLVAAALKHGVTAVVGASVFAATAVLLYLSSTLYHALPPGRAKDVFHVLDHSAIFLLIAGTYTPFTLGVLSGAWGWTLFGLVWGLATFGVVSKTAGGLRHPVLSTGLYVAMGWLIVVAIRPLWLRMPGPGLAWLVAGGLAYTAGVAFFAAPRLRYAHFVYHLFVVAGTACHFVAVYRYAA